MEKFVEYSFGSLKFIWLYGRMSLIRTLISILLGAVQTFPGMHYISYSADFTTKRVELRECLLMSGDETTDGIYDASVIMYERYLSESGVCIDDTN